VTHLSIWKPKYTEPRPRRLLALDGGGICGVISLEILAELERQLAISTGQRQKFRLGQHFDYIAGTSTGAIIATGLAIGMSVDELIEFYVSSGPRMFDRSGILQWLRNGYDDAHMRKMLKGVLGNRTLGASDLLCLLMIVTRNATTDSPWPVSNNPFAMFNQRRADCNLKVPLWQLVRASGAAPTYFPPEVLNWDSADPRNTFTFVDGGVTPYNNPAFLLYRMATAPEYGLKWAQGERNLALISIGTGAAPFTEKEVRDHSRLMPVEARSLISILIRAANVDQDVNCRTVGRCVFGLPIECELGDMIPRDGDPRDGIPVPLESDLGRSFLYARYDPDVTEAGLASIGRSDLDPASIQAVDRAEFIEDMRAVGRAFAKRHVNIDSFGGLLV
jgi:hypothetical protein